MTDVLDAKFDPATGKLSFATDAFSTYALVVIGKKKFAK